MLIPTVFLPTKRGVNLTPKWATELNSKVKIYAFFPQQRLYFFPLPHGQGSFLPIFLCGAFAGEWNISTKSLNTF
jgi:hypothetical protein